jgi:hypothetical protein
MVPRLLSDIRKKLGRQRPRRIDQDSFASLSPLAVDSKSNGCFARMNA